MAAPAVPPSPWVGAAPWGTVVLETHREAEEEKEKWWNCLDYILSLGLLTPDQVATVVTLKATRLCATDYAMRFSDEAFIAMVAPLLAQNVEAMAVVENITLPGCSQGAQPNDHLSGLRSAIDLPRCLFRAWQREAQEKLLLGFRTRHRVLSPRKVTGKQLPSDISHTVTADSRVRHSGEERPCAPTCTHDADQNAKNLVAVATKWLPRALTRCVQRVQGQTLRQLTALLLEEPCRSQKSDIVVETQLWLDGCETARASPTREVVVVETPHFLDSSSTAVSPTRDVRLLEPGNVHDNEVQHQPCHEHNSEAHWQFAPHDQKPMLTPSSRNRQGSAAISYLDRAGHLPSTTRLSRRRSEANSTRRTPPAIHRTPMGAALPNRAVGRPAERFGVALWQVPDWRRSEAQDD